MGGHEWHDAIAEAYDKELTSSKAWDYGRRVIELAKIKKNELVLDLGCGTGRLTFFAHKKGSRVISVDLSPRMISISRKRITDAYYILADVTHLPIRNSVFDKIVSNEVWVHMPTENMRQTYLMEIARVMKNEGLAVISAIRNENGIGKSCFEIINNIIFRRRSKERVEYISRYDDFGNAVKGFAYNFTIEKIRERAINAGFKSIKIQKSVVFGGRTLKDRLTPRRCYWLLDMILRRNARA